jgi:hypothetical protein
LRAIWPWWNGESRKLPGSYPELAALTRGLNDFISEREHLRHIATRWEIWRTA